MPPSSLVDEAVQALAAAVPPSAQIWLFGSQVRGDATPDSDLDFLVIEPEVTNRA